MDCGIQCSIDKNCFSFKYENSICHHGGIQQPSIDIEAEDYMQKPISKLKVKNNYSLYYFLHETWCKKRLPPPKKKELQSS